MAAVRFLLNGKPFSEDGAPPSMTVLDWLRTRARRRMVLARRPSGSGPADRFVAELPALADAVSALPPCVEYRYGAQAFLRPRSLDALFAATAQFPAAILLAGGTDLGLRVSKDREALPAVISVEVVEELQRIKTEAGALEIGGARTYTPPLPPP